MRRIVMFNQVSAEGFFASPDGMLDWVVPEPRLDASAADNLAGADAMIFGRRTYEMFESFWPAAAQDAHAAGAQDPHAPGERSHDMSAIARWINESAKLVFSTTRTDIPWQNSRVLPAFDPAEIEALKAGPGKDIMVFGSGSIVARLTEHGLIDEYQLVVQPVFLGTGRPLIEDANRRRKLELLEATSYPSGIVRLRYAPKN